MMYDNLRCAICGAAVHSSVHCPREEKNVCYSHCMDCEWHEHSTSLTRCLYREELDRRRVAEAKENIRAMCETLRAEAKARCG